MPVGIRILLMLSSTRIVLMLSSISVVQSSSSDEESCSRQDTLGFVRNNNSCHMTVIDVGWYSQNVWNRSSCKAGHSNIMWALSSLTAEHKRHVGSTSGFTFDCYFWMARQLSLSTILNATNLLTKMPFAATIASMHRHRETLMLPLLPTLTDIFRKMAFLFMKFW